MQTRTKIYLVMAHLGALSSLGFLASVLLDWPDFFKGLMLGMLLLPLLIAPLRRMRDEYIDSLWRAGTAWAFVTMVLLFLFAPFIHGIYEGFRGLPNGDTISAEAAGYAAILMFFAGFHVEWVRSRI